MAELNRKAYVARTSHDQKHLNRLTVPEWGVVEVRLKKGRAGSLSHRLPGATTPRAPSGAGTDSFNFAPGPQLDPVKWTADTARTDRVTVLYDLHNPFLNITKAKLQLFRRFYDDAIWERELTDDELLDGPHDVQFGWDYVAGKARTDWGGYFDESKRFPDGFVTVEHSPYKLRILAEGPGQSNAQVAWTYFHVLIDHLELEWGGEESIPSSDAESRQPFHELLHPRGGGAAPVPTTANMKIYLNSALFGSSGWFHDHSDEWFDNTLYKQYKSMWGKGPEIPIFCKIWIRDSGGRPVIAPLAIGKTKFLWDWESRAGATPSAFVNNAQNYDVNVSQPTGQNCHDDRGGKRGGDPVFPEQDGYSARDKLKSDDFPFKVAADVGSRKWAVYSYAWREKALAAKTGVLFRPSRMAGDKYRITVYAAHETNDGEKPRLEVNTPAPLPIDPSLKAMTGDIEVWRRVPMIRLVKKTGGVVNLTFANIAVYYQAAFLDLVDDTGGATIYPSGDWNTNIADAVSDWSSKEQLIVDSTVNQYTSGNDGIFLRTPAQFRAAMIASGKTAAETTTWMNNNGMSNISTYSKTAENLVRPALVKVFDKKFRSDIPGVNVSQVAVVHNQVAPAAAAGPYSIVDGQAANYPSADRNHCGFLSMLDPTQRMALGFASTSEITAAHEFGHHFFMPHPAPVNGESGYNAHDTTVNNCVMSYNPGARVFCGLCQLRLRGWDKSELKTTPVNNRP